MVNQFLNSIRDHSKNKNQCESWQKEWLSKLLLKRETCQIMKIIVLKTLFDPTNWGMNFQWVRRDFYKTSILKYSFILERLETNELKNSLAKARISMTLCSKPLKVSYATQRPKYRISTSDTIFSRHLLVPRLANFSRKCMGSKSIHWWIRTAKDNACSWITKTYLNKVTMLCLDTHLPISSIMS